LTRGPFEVRFTHASLPTSVHAADIDATLPLSMMRCRQRPMPLCRRSCFAADVHASLPPTSHATAVGDKATF